MGTRTCAGLARGDLSALVISQASALAAAPRPNTASPLLWATIDVCNSAAHPDTIGIRGSMPGTGDAHELMYMSFRVEYRSSPGHWRSLGGAGQSAFVAVGNGAALARQAGQDFEVVPRASRQLPAARRGRLRVAPARTHGRERGARDARRPRRGGRGRSARLQRDDLQDLRRTGAGRS